MFRGSDQAFLADNSFRASGKRLGTDIGRWAVLSRASRRTSRRKERGALLSQVRRSGSRLRMKVRRGCPTSRWKGKLDTKGADGQADESTVEAVLAAGPVNGSVLRKTISERETVEKESHDITQKGEARSWGLEPAEGESYLGSH